MLAFSPDGKILAFVSADTKVRLWDPATGAPRGVLEGHSGWVHTLAFSPDGKILASGSEDSTVRLWDPMDGQAMASFDMEGPIYTLLFSSCGSSLITNQGNCDITSAVATGCEPSSYPEDEFWSHSENWICYKNFKVIFIPGKFRGPIGCSNGASVAWMHGLKVYVMTFDSSALPHRMYQPLNNTS